tara:strand:- start:7718 stop:8083 length:366 start_codon:yes stop_codon:yes gene_type:complete
MACTRNKNTYCDYVLEQRNNKLIKDYNLFQNGSNGKAYTTGMPSLGYMPSHMPANVLSNNAVDIESRLFGINSCNLVNTQKPITPEINTIQFNDYFHMDKAVLIPEPLVIENNQRPFPTGN